MKSKIITFGHTFPSQINRMFGVIVGILTAILAGGGLTSSAYAANVYVDEIPWYEIEVIIFANKEQLGLNSETWAEEVKNDNYPKIIELKFQGEADIDNTSMPNLDPASMTETASGTVTPVPGFDSPEFDQAYVFLDTNELKLSDISAKLQRAPKYDVLLHIAWRQPTVSRKESIPVFVTENMSQKLSQKNSRNIAQNNSLNAPVIQTVINEDELGPKPPRLSGTLRLSVSRYLHLASDLHMRLPFMIEEEVTIDEPVESSSEQGGFGSFFGVGQEPQSAQTILREREILTDFRLSESRRLRSSEIHYFDNPMFGMVVQVVPYEIAKPEPEPEPETIDVIQQSQTR